MGWLQRALWALSLTLCAGAVQALPSFAQVQQAHRPSERLLLSREGEILQRQRVDFSVRRGAWVALDEMSPALRQALLLSEDRRFYAHSGIDWRAVSAAAWGQMWHQRTRGASTITMQLAGLLDQDLRARNSGRSVVQKMGQALGARDLEAQWRKDQILEAYLNMVAFRGEIVGIDALSRTLFAKAAHGLDAREAAIAAALVRGPNAKPDVVAQRACTVLWAMQAQDMEAQGQERQKGQRTDSPQRRGSDCLALSALTQAALQRRAFAASEGQAPHFARRWLRAHGPEVLRSTLSAPLQRFAVQTLAQQLRELRGRHVEDGAIVVLDNASGQILAWVGSSGAMSAAAEVDGVLAQRQPGSTLKPFLYAQAIAERRLTAASLIDDSPAQIPTAAGLYIPQNYDRRFRGWVSVRQALAASLNVPAVRTLAMVTPDAFFAQLRALGLGLRESGGYFGYSLALGSSEVNLLELTNAYRTLANGGHWSAVVDTPQPRGQAQAQAKRPSVLDARAAFIVGDILSDPLARAPTFGTDSLLGTRFWSAVKTGTSKDMRDNWAMGWSEHYTVGVWVGNASGAAMHAVSGTSGAAPVWAAIMGYLHRSKGSRAPRPPLGLQPQSVRFGDDAQGQPLEAARTEWFLPGTEQVIFAIKKGAVRAGVERASGQNDLKIRITAPASGTVLALDPDIPPAHQRLALVASGGQALRWHIDGREVGRGPRASWPPWPGEHRIELRDAQNRVLDALRIEVRGAGALKCPAKTCP